MQSEFDVAVATGEEGFLTTACRETAIPVHIVPHLRREIRPVADARALWELYRLIQRLRPDLIHAHTFKAGFLGRLAGRLLKVSSVYTIHSWLFGTSAMPRLWSLLAVPCERMAGNWCERLITVSDAGTRLVQRYGILSKAKVVTIPNGVPDCAERANLSLQSVAAVIMVARFTEVKEHDILLRAFARVRRGPRLLLIGEGPTRARCEKLANELGIRDRVEFLGDRDDVPSLLASSHVFVLASTFEMSPISILEAMRAGLPVIASNSGGACEAVVDGESGLLVPSGSVEALEQALTRVLDDGELRIRLGRQARRRFEQRFLCAHQAARTRSVYLEVLFGSGANSVWNEAWYFGLPDYSSKLSRNVKRVSRPVVPERQSNSYKRDRPAS
jgi:glycosyltransferase involved in cell wall biosynthesis